MPWRLVEERRFGLRDAKRVVRAAVNSADQPPSATIGFMAALGLGKIDPSQAGDFNLKVT
jgi:hypothetical protein